MTEPRPEPSGATNAPIRVPAIDRVLVDDASTPANSDAMFAALEAAVAKQDGAPLAGARALSTTARIVATIAFSALLVFGFGASACRHDVATYPSSRLFTEALFLSLTLGATLALSLRPITRPALRRPALVASILGTLAVALLVALVPGPDMPHVPFSELGPVPRLHWSSGIPCIGIGMVIGVPVYMLARLFDRGHRASPYLSAAAAGVAGNLALALHCPSGDVVHKLTAHASLGFIFLACLLLAAIIERRFPTDPGTPRA